MPPATLPRIRRRAQLVAVGVIVALAGMGAVSAQAASTPWSPPVAVTTDEGAVIATVTAPDGTITSVVDSNTTGIMAVSSTDGGASWQSPVSLGSSGDKAFRPTIGMTSTGLLAIAWVESTSDVLDPNVTISSIQIVISSDGGSTWSAKTPLATVSADVDDPAIGSSSPSGFTVVWAEGFAKLSSSTANSTAVGGATWSDPTVITEDRNSYGTTSLVALGTSDILAVFHELDGVTSQFSVQSRRSTDGGLTWAPAVMVAPAWNGLLGNSNYTIASSPVPGSIVVFWNHQREGGGEALFAATSSDSGSSWGSVIEVSLDAQQLSYYAPAVVDSMTVGVVWHERSGSDAEAYYAEVEVGATSATSPVLIDSSSLSYERQPAVTSFGTTRVATWFAEGASRAETALFSAASCDGGATWRATGTVVSGDGVSVKDAVVAISGTVVTAFWREYDALGQRVPLASSIDDPCAVAAPLADAPELAATGASDVSLAALGAALGMLVLGVFAVAARRAMVRQ